MKDGRSPSILLLGFCTGIILTFFACLNSVRTQNTEPEVYTLFHLFLALGLVLFTGFYIFEAITQNRIRVKGGRQWFQIALYHWAYRAHEPVTFWFWLSFYSIGFFLGLYILFRYVLETVML